MKSNMSINWMKIMKKYAGLWVAMKQDEETVITSAKNARKAFQDAKEKGYARPILVRIPKEVVNYVGSIWQV